MGRVHGESEADQSARQERLNKMENSDQELKPLRYNPALKCDPQLEAMRPERLSKHTALPTGDWKRYLIKNPPSYEGSFADADIQKFRPNPVPSVMEDPWFVSQLPQSRNEIQQIKMRNRRFQQSCALQGHGARQQVGQAGLTEDMMMMTSMAYSDLQRQVQMFQTLPTAPIPAPRKTHLLTMNSQMGIEGNGFNYWYHNNMLGPYRD